MKNDTQAKHKVTERILQLADHWHSRLVEIRREFHMYPELSNQEFRTTSRINEMLQEFSIEKIETNLTTGTAAILHGKQDGPVIAIRADIDALPIQEENEWKFKSKHEGISHACGHDFHTAIAIGAALILRDLQDEFPGKQLPGSVKFFFQPAEETEGGAESMIHAGLLQNPSVNAIIGLHNKPEIPAGTIGIKEGFLMGSVDDFRICIKGKGGHAALPEKTIDPIVIGSAVVQLLQTIVSRAVSPLESAVVTVGQFHAGHATNVIPNEAVIAGTVRTSSPAIQNRIENLLTQSVRQTVEAMGGKAEIEYARLYPPVVNDAKVAAVLKQSAVKIVGATHTLEAEPTMGGEDFSFFQLEVPGCYYWLGTGNPEKGVIHGWHHPEFKVDEEAIKTGSAMMAQSVLDLMDKLK
ncbi:M20 metallopeptidase family protein [Aneurinibacillus terranovensis]|uniref:M20 metallopeptidase family protein n=1 Tax=Aneurinibacillus terranovensis TaxID=278991 RepID=UPI0003F8EFE0|nr:M20 family metallopeptidase [Aneurinibacillus terranovensis]